MKFYTNVNWHTKLLPIGPFGLNPDRALVADYSHTLYVDTDVFIVGLKIEDDPWALFRPFEWEVWLGIFLIAPIFWFSAGFIDLVHKGDAKWSSLAIFTYGSMLNQDLDQTQISKQTWWYKRFYCISWVWVCFILTTCYSGTDILPE